mmetsp:Transcript_9440/g.17906  ORF Transcript_9440/g.17906 Transcript_9440/m.17906 type:complete len:163 (+) Transcript_9440:23-511(+)
MVFLFALLWCSNVSSGNQIFDLSSCNDLSEQQHRTRFSMVSVRFPQRCLDVANSGKRLVLKKCKASESSQTFLVVSASDPIQGSNNRTTYHLKSGAHCVSGLVMTPCSPHIDQLVVLEQIGDHVAVRLSANRCLVARNKQSVRSLQCHANKNYQLFTLVPHF